MQAFVYFRRECRPLQAIAALFVKDNRANDALLALLVVQYPLVPTLSLMGVGR